MRKLLVLAVLALAACSTPDHLADGLYKTSWRHVGGNCSIVPPDYVFVGVDGGGPPTVSLWSMCPNGFLTDLGGQRAIIEDGSMDMARTDFYDCNGAVTGQVVLFHVDPGPELAARLDIEVCGCTDSFETGDLVETAR